MKQLTLAIILFLALAAPAGAQTVLRGQLAAGEDGVVVSRHLFGHFSEHLGTGIYGGLWTEDNRVREDVLTALQKIEVPNLRWPGGCFADYYTWRHGVGPREARPMVVNTLWGGVTENNAFGTHEFLDLAERLGAEPVVVGNVGSGTVGDMAAWWEYINHPGRSPMSDWRRTNGRDEPWNVRFWGVGNESWGCGGNMRPEFYADLYKRFATFLPGYPNVRPFRIATGAAGEDYNWTEVLMREAGSMIDGIDLHHYTILGDWVTRKGHATEFGEAEYFELMRRALRQDSIIAGHRAVMDRFDPQGRVWLIVGEWGVWHEQEEGSTPGFLYQQNTLRDALMASASLDIFARHAERVRMANIAQMVNVLQAMILTRGDEMVLTPTYHVFDFYTAHQDAERLSLRLDAGTYTFEGRSIPAVSGLATRDSLGRVHVTLTNLDPNAGRTIQIELKDMPGARISGRVLTAGAVQAHNTFENPTVVQPQPFTGARLEGGTLYVELPARALVSLELAP